MAWFFVTIFVGLAGEPPVEIRNGPYASREQCEIVRARLAATMPAAKTTPCLKAKK